MMGTGYFNWKLYYEPETILTEPILKLYMIS